MSDANLLEVRGLAAGYGDLRVVWDVSLTVRPGRVTALLGRNGVGKTTTLRAIVGLNRALAGEILLAGEPVGGLAAHRRPRRGIAFVQEGKRIFHQRTVEENLLLGGYARGVGRRGLRADAVRVYEMFPALGARAKTVAGQLSGGQQQMVAIGQALMANPKVLLLDEPSGGLAPSIVAEVMTVVSELASGGLGVLLVEQAVEAAMSVASDVTVLDMGRVALQRETGATDDADIIRQAYFGRPATAS
jgi:branched-chain amino acid transport system ATP-binding protein